MFDKRLPHSPDWTYDMLHIYMRAIEEEAKEYGLDYYPNQIEIISSEQMLDAYTSVGMPTSYKHWSFGKSFISQQRDYQRGRMGLAYEIVINSNPCIAYLMEENTMTMQALVIAHASFGHNSFFKGNYLFRQWTDAEGIIDYLIYAKNYIAECEEKYGQEDVEYIIDACHALQYYGVDQYKRPGKASKLQVDLREKEKEEYRQYQVNDLWRTLPKKQDEDKQEKKRFPAEPQENLLYFLEKNAPRLESWQREIIRIIRKISQYFYPQRQTQVMNEGWATFWHYTLLNSMYAKGRLSDGFMMEFLHSHSSVVWQPDMGDRRYSGINVYALGFAMMRDIRRICENPTEEDRKWFPDIAGSDWIKTLDYAMRNFKDESFISQYLSPKVIRDMKLFSIYDDSDADEYIVSSIHNDDGYRDIRQKLSDQYNIHKNMPDIQIWDVDVYGDRSITLKHFVKNGRVISEESGDAIGYFAGLWGFHTELISEDEDGNVLRILECDVED